MVGLTIRLAFLTLSKKYFIDQNIREKSNLSGTKSVGIGQKLLKIDITWHSPLASPFSLPKLILFSLKLLIQNDCLQCLKHFGWTSITLKQFKYHKVASSRPVYNFGTFLPMSQYISIKFTHHKPSKN